MAKTQKKPEKERKKMGKPEEPIVNKKPEKSSLKQEAKLIRILAKDIPGDKDVYSGLQLIRGISWAFSNALCKKLNLDKRKKIEDLTPQEIESLTNFLKNPEVPNFLLNRRKDADSGEELHLIGADLDLQKEFDIKKLKKMKSYKGIRHSAGLPVRGQKTRSNFRKNRKKGGAVGVRKKAKK